MSTTQEVNDASEVARRNLPAFLLGGLVIGAIVFGLYQWLVIPGRDAQMAAANERIALLSEKLAATSAVASAAMSPTASMQSSAACTWNSVAEGAFSSTVGDFKAAGWHPDDAAVDTPAGQAPHTRYVSITSNSVLTGTGRPTKYEWIVGGVIRNPQFPRIELKVPKGWFGRDVKMKVALRWQELRLVPSGYPGVVAINVVYRRANENRDRFIVLFGEHFPSQAWESYELPEFRLPADTAHATVRLGLHGVFGTLDVDEVSFEVCT